MRLYPWGACWGVGKITCGLPQVRSLQFPDRPKTLPMIRYQETARHFLLVLGHFFLPLGSKPACSWPWAAEYVRPNHNASQDSQDAHKQRHPKAAVKPSMAALASCPPNRKCHRYLPWGRCHLTTRVRRVSISDRLYFCILLRGKKPWSPCCYRILTHFSHTH